MYRPGGTPHGVNVQRPALLLAGANLRSQRSAGVAGAEGDARSLSLESTGYDDAEDVSPVHPPEDTKAVTPELSAQQSLSPGHGEPVPAVQLGAASQEERSVQLGEPYEALEVEGQSVEDGDDSLSTPEVSPRAEERTSRLTTTSTRKRRRVIVVGDSFLKGTEGPICRTDPPLREVCCLPRACVKDVTRVLPTLETRTTAQLKCLYTNAHSMGNKQEELEAIVHQENYDMVAITEMWWDDSHNWSAAMDGYKLFRRDRRGRRGGGVPYTSGSLG
ncbi:hypothetical protein QYF61_004852 [Mycteria americana]|uniref:Uncharacterized protein n=1 Tax=Mycteria americana TaxID=33587 RepID=A0AAN7MGU1_MYCAM|nr:hypothetical protein QYF61_004852 [Mycteria americana]